MPRKEYSPCFECCLCFVSTAQAASPAGHVACMGVESAYASPAAEHNGVPSHSHKQNCPSPARKTPAAPLAAMEAACTSGSCSDGSPAAWMHLLACRQLARQEELGTTHSSSMMCGVPGACMAFGLLHAAIMHRCSIVLQCQLLGACFVRHGAYTLVGAPGCELLSWHSCCALLHVCAAILQCLAALQSCRCAVWIARS